MKKICLAFLLLTLSAVSLFAQEPACNTGRAEGAARGALAQCTSGQRQDLEVTFTTICDCPGTGITVEALGGPRCNPNEPCPFFLILLGTVQLDCDYNVVSSTCNVK
ncbi:MAG: hypothetical protein ACJ75H_21460 [Thermoanaerobaculia bacterium]